MSLKHGETRNTFLDEKEVVAPRTSTALQRVNKGGGHPG